MYLTVRKYEIKPGVGIEEIVQRVQEGFIPIVSQVPGFAAYHIVDTGNETVASVTLFQTQAGADDATQQSSAWVSENLLSLLRLPAEITKGEVILSKTS